MLHLSKYISTSKERKKKRSGITDTEFHSNAPNMTKKLKLRVDTFYPDQRKFRTKSKYDWYRLCMYVYFSFSNIQWEEFQEYRSLGHSLLDCIHCKNIFKFYTNELSDETNSLHISAAWTAVGLKELLQWSENSCGHYVILPRMPEIKFITE